MNDIKVRNIAIEWIPATLTRRGPEYDAIIRVCVERYKEWFGGMFTSVSKELYYARTYLGRLSFEPATFRSQGKERVIDEEVLKSTLRTYNAMCGVEQRLSDHIWDNSQLQGRLRHALEYIFLNQLERKDAIRRADNWLRW